MVDLKNLREDKILEFFDAGHNIVIAGDVDTSKAFRILINSMGADLDPFVRDFCMGILVEAIRMEDES